MLFSALRRWLRKFAPTSAAGDRQEFPLSSRSASRCLTTANSSKTSFPPAPTASFLLLSTALAATADGGGEGAGDWR